MTGGQFTGGQFTGGQLDWGATGLGGNLPGGNCRGAIDRGAIVRGGIVLIPAYMSLDPPRRMLHMDAEPVAPPSNVASPPPIASRDAQSSPPRRSGRAVRTPAGRVGDCLPVVGFLLVSFIKRFIHQAHHSFIKRIIHAYIFASFRSHESPPMPVVHILLHGISGSALA